MVELFDEFLDFSQPEALRQPANGACERCIIGIQLHDLFERVSDATQVTDRGVIEQSGQVGERRNGGELTGLNSMLLAERTEGFRVQPSQDEMLREFRK